jgi:hypothetical protein
VVIYQSTGQPEGRHSAHLPAKVAPPLPPAAPILAGDKDLHRAWMEWPYYERSILPKVRSTFRYEAYGVYSSSMKSWCSVLHAGRTWEGAKRRGNPRDAGCCLAGPFQIRNSMQVDGRPENAFD